MENVEISSAQYNLNSDGENCSINCIFGGQRVSVPLDPANRHYAEILRQVEAGELTIQDADSGSEDAAI